MSKSTEYILALLVKFENTCQPLIRYWKTCRMSNFLGKHVTYAIIIYTFSIRIIFSNIRKISLVFTIGPRTAFRYAWKEPDVCALARGKRVWICVL